MVEMTRWLRLSTGIFGFLLATAYWPRIAGAATTPRWLVLVAGAAVLSVFPLLIKMGKSNVSAPEWCIGAGFVAWSLLTASWSPALEAFDATWKMLLLVVLFMVGARLSDLRPLLIGCGVGVAVSSALVVLERLGPLADPHGNLPSGLFVNGLYLAEFAAMVVVGLLALGHWRWALLCAPSLLLVSLPRGPLLALAVVGVVWLWRAGPIVRLWAAPATVVCGCALAAAIALRPDSVWIRLLTWQDMLGKLMFFGHGLGSYASGALIGADPLVRKTHANNDLLEIAYETGAVGAILACGFVVALFWPRSQAGKAPGFDPDIGRSNRPAAAMLIVVVFLVEGLFGFPLHMAATAGLFALAAGHLARGS